MGKLSEESIEKLKKSLKEKWASGTRKPNPPETYVKASITHKKMYAEGKRVAPTLTSEQARERQKCYSREKMLKVNRLVGDKKIGVPNNGRGAASPDNWKSKYWILKAPNQQIIKGLNLNHLIRTHAHLFNEEDINWNGKHWCRASRGLRSLFEMKKDGTGAKYNSWKGWQIGDKKERSSL